MLNEGSWIEYDSILYVKTLMYHFLYEDNGKYVYGPLVF